MLHTKIWSGSLCRAVPEKDIETIVAIKKLYDQKFQAGGYIRFDEQISLAVWLLEQFPGIRKKLQNMYSYILVDEAQDIDEMQGKLIRLLVEESNPQIAIFGDTDQAIYGFRGGSNKFMLEFLQLYPEALEIKLMIISDHRKKYWIWQIG